MSRKWRRYTCIPHGGMLISLVLSAAGIGAQQLNDIFTISMRSFHVRTSNLVEVPTRGKMFSPPPNVTLVALSFLAFFQFCIFRPQVLYLAHKSQSFANVSSETPPSALNKNTSAIDPLLPDVLRPKIRQVSMRVYNATNETNDALDERCMATHIEYGKRWGYPTHVLREDVRGKGEWRELVFSKPLYMLSLAVAEMAKPTDERAEWLV